MKDTTDFVRRKMVRLLLCVCIASVLVGGCGKIGVAGKYVSEKNQKNYLELKTDGTFFVQEDSMGMAGKYEIDGDTITLKTDMGLASRGKIEGKTVIDNDGDRWTKQ